MRRRWSRARDAETTVAGCATGRARPRTRRTRDSRSRARAASSRPPAPAELAEHVDAASILRRRRRLDGERGLPRTVVPSERGERPGPQGAASAVMVWPDELELGRQRERARERDPRGAARAGPHVVADPVA